MHTMSMVLSPDLTRLDANSVEFVPQDRLASVFADGTVIPMAYNYLLLHYFLL